MFRMDDVNWVIRISQSLSLLALLVWKHLKLCGGWNDDDDDEPGDSISFSGMFSAVKKKQNLELFRNPLQISPEQ